MFMGAVLNVCVAGFYCLCVSMFYMFKAIIDQGNDMIVIQCIVDTLALSSVFNNFQGSQNPELMGYGGLGLLTDHGDVAHAMFSFQQCQYNFKPGRIA
jgi:hypothetical protein